jgi:hypothetical protein
MYKPLYEIRIIHPSWDTDAGQSSNLISPAAQSQLDPTYVESTVQKYDKYQFLVEFESNV